MSLTLSRMKCMLIATCLSFKCNVGLDARKTTPWLSDYIVNCRRGSSPNSVCTLHINSSFWTNEAITPFSDSILDRETPNPN